MLVVLRISLAAAAAAVKTKPTLITNVNILRFSSVELQLPLIHVVRSLAHSLTHSLAIHSFIA